jgi:hypothetical protein
MKMKRLLLMIFSCLISLNLYAQDVLKLGEYKINKSTMIVKSSSLQNSNKVWIQYKDAIMNKPTASGESRFFRGDISYEFSSQYNIIDCIVKVLGHDRISKLSSDKVVTSLVIFNYEGKVVEVDYLTTVDCGLTLKEFDELTSYIKANVTFVTNPRMPKGKLLSVTTQRVSLGSKFPYQMGKAK